VEIVLSSKMKRNSRKLISSQLRKKHTIKKYREKWISNLRNTLKENLSRWILNSVETSRTSLMCLGTPQSIRNQKGKFKKNRAARIIQKAKGRNSYNKRLMPLEKILKKIKNYLKSLMINCWSFRTKRRVLKMRE